MNKILVALDHSNPLDAFEIVLKLRDKVDGFKINHLLWEQSEYLQNCGELFVDCKVWDTPNTVREIIKKIIDKGGTIVSVSTFNNSSVFDECIKLSNQIKILGVTYLTSWSREEQYELYNKSIKGMWKENIDRARDCLSGIVCSPLDIKDIDEPGLIKVCPGIGNNLGQTRTVTPKQAVDMGADYLVIGRSITQSIDPVETIDTIRNIIR